MSFGAGRHGKINALGFEQLRVACQQLHTLHGGGHAPARDHAEVLRRRQLCAQVLFAAPHDGLAQRVLGELLGAGRKAIQIHIGVSVRKALHGHHFRRAAGQGAGLVKGQNFHPGKALQRVAFADKKTVLRGVADGRHDGGGRCQHQRTGAEHHQNGHGADDLAGDGPGEGGSGQRDDHDPGGPAVSKAHDFGLACVGRLHQPDHPLDGAILAHLGGPHLKGTKLVHRAAGHLVAHGLVHGQAFAGHDGLIDGGLPGRDDAVHGHRLARQHPQHVAHLHLLSRNDRLGAVFQHAGRLRGQVHQLFNAGAGFGHGEFLQQARGHAFGCGVLPLLPALQGSLFQSDLLRVVGDGAVSASCVDRGSGLHTLQGRRPFAAVL